MLHTYFSTLCLSLYAYMDFVVGLYNLVVVHVVAAFSLMVMIRVVSLREYQLYKGIRNIIINNRTYRIERKKNQTNYLHQLDYHDQIHYHYYNTIYVIFFLIFLFDSKFQQILTYLIREVNIQHRP